MPATIADPAANPAAHVMATTDGSAPAATTAGGPDETDIVMADVPQGPASSAGNSAGGAALAMAATVVPTPTPVPTTSVAHGDATRQYLNTHVTGAVLAGLKEIAKHQPQEPVRALGEFLIRMADDMARQNNH